MSILCVSRSSAHRAPYKLRVGAGRRCMSTVGFHRGMGVNRLRSFERKQAVSHASIGEWDRGGSSMQDGHYKMKESL